MQRRLDGQILMGVEAIGGSIERESDVNAGIILLLAGGEIQGPRRRTTFPVVLAGNPAVISFSRLQSAMTVRTDTPNIALCTGLRGH
jgi:hypothetical protein